MEDGKAPFYGFYTGEDMPNRHRRIVEVVEFDIVVTAGKGTETKGGFGITVGAATLGSAGKSEKSDKAESRVRFRVPMLFPNSLAPNDCQPSLEARKFARANQPHNDRVAHWLSRKNCCVPKMGLVTVFCPLTTTGFAEIGVQTAVAARLVVDCNVQLVKLVGHVKTKSVPDE
jgi:hypothetical protein